MVGKTNKDDHDHDEEDDGDDKGKGYIWGEKEKQLGFIDYIYGEEREIAKV